MTNLNFLYTIYSQIFKSEDNNKYYANIPFVSYDPDKSYLENKRDNEIFVLLDENFLNNEDAEEFISMLDDRYEFLNNADSPIDLIHIASSNYNYFKNLNVISDIAIDEDDAKNTNITFMNILKETFRYSNLEPTDYLYKNIIDFYSNGQFDDALILMNSIFNNQINVTSTQSTCGCNQQASNCSSSNLNSSNALNTGTELVNYEDASCADKYKAAIYLWLQKMLSDTEFYCNWLFIGSEDDPNEWIPNDTIIDKLIELLQFLLDNFDLSNLGDSSSSSKSFCGHKSSIKCQDLFVDRYGNIITGDGSGSGNGNNDSNSACSNYNIIKNYIELLKYVKADKVEENKNKIYIYGKKFAEIFPLLSF